MVTVLIFKAVKTDSARQTWISLGFQFVNFMSVEPYVDIESFWKEGYASQIPNSGHELAIYVL